MPKNTHRKTWHKLLSIVLGIISLILITLALINFFFLFESRTFWWHLENPEPLQWYGLKITVPENLVAKYQNNELLIYKMEDATKLGISFHGRKGKRAIKKVYDFDTYYRKYNLDVIEKKNVSIFGIDSFWIKTTGKSGEFIYRREDIWPLSVPIRITFVGEENNRKVFEEVIDNVKWEPKWAEEFIRDK